MPRALRSMASPMGESTSVVDALIVIEEKLPGFRIFELFYPGWLSDSSVFGADVTPPVAIVARFDGTQIERRPLSGRLLLRMQNTTSD